MEVYTYMYKRWIHGRNRQIEYLGDSIRGRGTPRRAWGRSMLSGWGPGYHFKGITQSTFSRRRIRAFDGCVPLC